MRYFFMADQIIFDNYVRNQGAIGLPRARTNRQIEQEALTQRKVEALESASARQRANQSVASLFDPTVENNYKAIVAGLGINSDAARSAISGVAGGVGILAKAVEDARDVVHEVTGLDNLLEPVNKAYEAVENATGLDVSDIRTSEWLEDFAEEASGSISVYGASRKNTAQFTGDIDDPSSWGVSNQMTLQGLSYNVLEALGYMAPQFAGRFANLGARGISAVGAAVGGIQAGYGSAEEEEAYLEQFTAEQMYEQFAYTRDLVDNQNVTLDEARDLTIRRGKAASGWSNAAYGAASGALFQRVIGTRGKSILDSIPGIDKSVLGRAAAITGGSATVEGVQELGEQLIMIGASNIAIGDDRNIFEDTVNPLMYGIITGGTLGAPASISPATSQAAERKYLEKYGTRLGEVINNKGANLPAYFQIANNSFNAKILSLEIAAMKGDVDGEMSREELADAALVAIESTADANQKEINRFDPAQLETNKRILARIENNEAKFRESQGDKVYEASVKHYKEGIEAVENGSYKSKLDRAKKRQEEVIEATNILQDIVNAKEAGDANSVDIVTETDGAKVLNHIASFPTHYTTDQIYDALRKHEGTIPPKERELMRLIAETSSKVDTLSGIGTTASKVIIGDLEWRGINTYRQNISRHVRNGNLGAAQLELDNLTRFSAVHLSKKEAMAQAALVFQETGTNIQMIPQGGGSWVMADRVYTPREVESMGILTIGRNSGNLINQIAAEADALNSAVHEAQRAIQLAQERAQAKPAQETTPADTTAPEATETAPAADSEAVQRTVQEQPQTSAPESNAATQQTIPNQPSEAGRVQPEAGEAETVTPDTDNVQPQTQAESVDAELASYEQINVPRTDGTGEQIAPEGTVDDVPTPDPNAVTESVKAQSTETLQRAKAAIEARAEEAPLQVRQETLLREIDEELAARAQREFTEHNVGYEVLEPEVVATQPEAVTNSNYRKVNLVSRFFNKARRMLPLNTVKNFREVTDKAQIEQILGYELTPAQERMFDNFMQNHDKFVEILDNYVGTEYNPEYRYRSMLDYFREPDGTLDPNLRTAIAFSAYMSAYDLAGAPRYLTLDQARGMVGDTNFNRVDYDTLRDYTMLKSTLIETLGNAAYNSMGIRATKDVPATLRDLLTGSLGLAALAVLKESGYISETTYVPTRQGEAPQSYKEYIAKLGDLEKLKRRTKNKKRLEEIDKQIKEHTNSKPMTLIKITRNNRGEILPELQNIRDAAVQNTSVLSELFTGTVDTIDPVFLREGQTASDLFTQQETKLGTQLSDKIIEAEKYKASLEWEPYEPMVEVWNKLTGSAKLTILGRDVTEGLWVQPNRALNVQAQIEATMRDIEYAENLINDPRVKEGRPIHFIGSIWSNLRSGYEQTSNPQTNKAMRGLLRIKDWKVTIDPSDTKQVEQLQLVLAQGFGVKLDNLDTETALKSFYEKIEIEEVSQALDILMDTTDNFTVEQSEVIAKAVDILGEGMSSLDALLTTARWMNTDADTPFEVSIAVEVDGKTNGPILTLISLGVTSGALSGVSYSDAGGYFTDSDVNNYSDYKQGNTNPDTYEAVARAFAHNLKHTLANINKADRDVLDAIMAFTGRIYSETFEQMEDGTIVETTEITGAGRNFVKQPITMFMFGASTYSASSNAFYETVLPNIYDAITEVRNSADGINTVDAARVLYNNISKLVGYKLPAKNMNDFLDRRYSDSEIRSMERNFNKVFGELLSDTLEHEFATFIVRRDNINTVSNASTSLYKAMYDAEVLALENQMLADPDTPVTRNGNMVFSLTNEQLAEVRERVVQAMPTVRVPLSDDSHMTGISLLKDTRETAESITGSSSDARYESRIPSPTSHDRYVNRVRSTEGAGVRGVINYIHSTDSAISQTVDRAHIPTLNAHDAKLAGIGQLTDTARELNTAAYTALTDTDISVESMETYHRILEHYTNNIDHFISLGVTPKQINEMLKDVDYSGLYSALVGKKGLLANVTTMGQYPFPNELPKIPDKVRQQATANMDKHLNRFLELRDSIADLRQKINSHYSLNTTDTGPTRAETVTLNAESTDFIAKAKGTLNPAEIRALESILVANPEYTPLQLADAYLHSNPDAYDRLETLLEPMVTEEVVTTPAIQEIISEGSSTTEPNQKLIKAFGDKTLSGHPLYTAIYNSIDKRTSLGKYQVRLLRSLRGILRDTVPVRVDNEPSLESIRNSALGHTIVESDGSISIVLNHVDSGLSGVNPTTAIHELVHAATTKQLEAARQGKATKDVAEAYRSLSNMYETLKERLDLANTSNITILNAMANLDEFVAWSMTDTDFQKILSEIPMTRELRQPTNMFTALKGFLTRLLGLDSPTALDAVINESTRIMEASRQAHQQATTAKVLNRQVGNPATNAQNMETLEVFDYLGSNSTATEHTTNVKKSLDKIVNTIYPKVGVNNLNNTYSQDLATLESKFLQGDIVNNNVSHAPFGLSLQESFAAEQIYTTMLGLSRENYVPLKQLRDIYLQAREQLEPKDFLNNWEEATPDERLAATEKYNELFQQENADQLANFTALALTSQEVIQALDKVQLKALSLRSAGREATVTNKIQSLFEWLLNMFFGTLDDVREGQATSETIKSIAWKLGQNEMKYRKRVAQNSESLLVRALKPIEGTTGALREGVVKATETELFSNTYLKTLTKLTNIAAQGKLTEFTELFQEMMVSTRTSKEGFIGGVLNELVGTTDQNRVHHTLHNGTKQLEQARRQINEAVQTLLNNSFENGGRDLTAENRRAILRGLLKTNASTLMRDDNIADVVKLVTDTDARNERIDVLKRRIVAISGNSDISNTYFYRATTLANYMATGTVIGRGMAMSSQDIATGKGLTFAQPNTEVAQRVQHLIEELVSLESINYLPKDIYNNLIDTVNSDSANGYKGIETTLKYHNHTKQLSKDNLFTTVDEQSYMTDGYISETYTNHNSLRVAHTKADIERLEEVGYVRVGELSKDTIDSTTGQAVLMSIPDGGPVSRVTGALSTTSKRSTGTQLNNVTSQNIADYMLEMEKVIKSGVVLKPDEVNSSINYAVPTFNMAGEISGMRYVMNERTKDNVLGRDNDFAQALGYTQSRILDKATSKPQNDLIVEAIKLTWEEGKSRHPHAYVRVAANSTDPKLQELWKLLPESTKRTAKEQFGGDFLMVRNDLLNLHFGYRKKSLAAPFMSDEFLLRNRQEALAGLGETARSIYKDPAQLTSFGELAEAIYVDLAVAMFGEKVGLRVKQGQDFWEAMVAEVKDIRVIKNFKTLASNISSNITVLIIYGSSFSEAIEKHREGALAAIEWESMVSEHLQLTNAVEAGIAPNDRATRTRIADLEQAMDRSPIKPLIEEGLYQAIVSDLEVNAKENQHITAFKEMLAPVTDVIPDPIKTVGRYAFVTKDTGLYKFLYKTTQMSDLVSRYALYYHLIERADNPMPHAQAAQEAREAFVNYDLPSTEWVQFANDMGGVMFTKYYLRIAKVMARLTGKYPARMLAGLAFSNYMDGVGVFTDSYMWNKLPNLWNKGAFEMVDAFTEPLPIAAAASLLD